jgi:hypothetical protein
VVTEPTDGTSCNVGRGLAHPSVAVKKTSAIQDSGFIRISVRRLNRQGVVNESFTR